MGALFLKLVLSGVFIFLMVDVDLSHVEVVEHLLGSVVVVGL